MHIITHLVNDPEFLAALIVFVSPRPHLGVIKSR